MQIRISFHSDLCHDCLHFTRRFTIECFDYFTQSLGHPSLQYLDTANELYMFHHMVNMVPLLGAHRGGLVHTPNLFARGFKFRNVLTKIVKVSVGPECPSDTSIYKPLRTNVLCKHVSYIQTTPISTRCERCCAKKRRYLIDILAARNSEHSFQSILGKETSRERAPFSFREVHT